MLARGQVADTAVWWQAVLARMEAMSAEYRAMTVTALCMLAENSPTGPVLAVGGSRPAARSGKPTAW
jgi:hypothetical protein